MAIRETVEHVLALAQQMGKRSRRCIVLILLMDLNIPEKNAGFEYLKRAVLFFRENPTMTIMEIYQKVGEFCPERVDARVVEQSIRQAITAALKNDDRTAFLCYFSRGRGCILKKPTNAELIAKLAHVLELYEGFCEKETEYER